MVAGLLPSCIMFSFCHADQIEYFFKGFETYQYRMHIFMSQKFLMKIILTTLLLLISNFNIWSQQHPLIGTWEMISIKGLNASGEYFSDDTTTVREIKIITPTHYMLIAHDVEGDSLVFNRCYAGSIKLDGNKYNE